jgi:hypothetical protein
LAFAAWAMTRSISPTRPELRSAWLPSKRWFTGTITLPVRVRGEERIDIGGRILEGKTIPFEILPAPVQTLWTLAYEKLTQAQGRFLQLLRWNQDIDGAHESYDFSPCLYWRSGASPPGDEHYATREPRSSPRNRASDVRGGHSIVWDEGHAESIRELWDLGANQPVAHELLCEARRLAADGAHRGALVIAATAVETGVKDHIGRLRPHTQWILGNLPSPPVHKLLGKYIPEMHASVDSVSNWKHLEGLWTRCQKLTEARNGTTHKGALVSIDELEAHLETAADVLYVLDVLAGHSWARQRVSEKVRTPLGWPAPSELRFRVMGWTDVSWEIDTPA